jgi:hypothetical protein
VLSGPVRYYCSATELYSVQALVLVLVVLVPELVAVLLPVLVLVLVLVPGNCKESLEGGKWWYWYQY